MHAYMIFEGKLKFQLSLHYTERGENDFVKKKKIRERKVNRMSGKRRLIAFVMLVALTVFGVLNVDTIRVSAIENPTIYISPQYVSTEDPLSEIGNNYILSIMTDYDGSDVYGYEFSLTFNPLVLEVVEVLNGDLITGNPIDLLWDDGDLNNPEGTLTLVRNGYYYTTLPPTLVSGPGTLATVNFTVVGYGASNIAFVESETRLIGFKEGGEWESYNIIDENFPHMYAIEGSIIAITIPGDFNGNGMVDGLDYGNFGSAWSSHGPNMPEPGDPPTWNWDPICDFNYNGMVDGLDYGTFGAHWGYSIY